MFIDKNNAADEENYNQAEQLKNLAYEQYNKVESSLKQDLIQALTFAKEKFNYVQGPLKDKKYEINIITGFDDMMVCFISTVDETFVHYGQRRDNGAEAIIMAVCEYVQGYNNPNMRF